MSPPDPDGGADSDGARDGAPGDAPAANTDGAASTPTPSRAALPPGWRVWTDEGDRIVWAYRPDVFDAAAYPAPCLPTVYLTRGRRGRRPGQRTDTDRWFVTLFLEPEVSREAGYRRHQAAIDGAVETMARFSHGQVDYRGLYQVPRARYLDALDALIHGDATDATDVPD